MIEFFSPEGLRVDGRRSLETRRIRAKLGVQSQADGSAYLEQGNTKVLCLVYGPKEMQSKQKARDDCGIVNCDFMRLKFCTAERLFNSRGRRTTEVSHALGTLFSSVVDTKAFPRSEIDLCIQVMEDDGGERAVSINAALLALVDAGIPLVDTVVASTGGLLEGEPVLDLNHVEANSGGANLTVAILPRTKDIVFLQMESRLPVDSLARVLDVGISACMSTHTWMQALLKERIADAVARRGGRVPH